MNELACRGTTLHRIHQGGRIYSSLDHKLTGNSNAGKLAIELGYRFVF